MNKQILVVDDAPAIHTLVKALLADEPVDVHSATSPSYGLTLVGSLRPDLLLLDVDMPEMDGYEFCRRMKADPSLWSVPVIYLSAQGESDQKVRGLELGAVDYVSKPFSNGELRARVRSALRTQALIANLESRELTDQLTGLGNRRMFQERMLAAISERNRTLKPIACAYIDLDGFTEINKLYGQPLGDWLLQKVGQVIRETYRPEDVTCRIRTDDFAVLMPDTSVDVAVSMAQAFKAQLHRSGLEYRGARIPITCGIGIAGSSHQQDHDVFGRAVSALERGGAKKSDALCVWGAAAIEPKTAAA